MIVSTTGLYLEMGTMGFSLAGKEQDPFTITMYDPKSPPQDLLRKIPEQTKQEEIRSVRGII
jgi:hypothetical protein